MKIHIPAIAVEITRKCQLKCAHCMRGDSENLDIGLKFIDALFSQIASIGHFCITGGEPTMNTDAVKYLVDKISSEKIPVKTFYVATNGININEAFVGAMLELFLLCDNPAYSFLEISNDTFHLSQEKYNDELVRDLPFYRLRHNKDNVHLKGRIHREGRGVKLSEATVISKAAPVKDKSSFEQILLNAKGEIINGCDWSYLNQAKHKLCDVKNLWEYYNTLK